MQKRRAGFTLIEIIVAIAIIVTLTAIITPNLGSALDKARIEKAAKILEAFVPAITSFKKDVQSDASLLSHLVEKPSSTDLNLCGKKYGGGITQWSGPYVERIITGNGLPIGIGTLQNKLLRDPPATALPLLGGGGAGVILMEVTGVTEEDAKSLNAIVDGDNSSTSGTVRWSTPPDIKGQVIVYYAIPTKSC